MKILETKEKGNELKAELVMAIRDYECDDREKMDTGLDIAASDMESDDQILLRIITAPETRSGVVSVNSVRKMAETMENQHYDKGVLISQRFSEAAKRMMMEKEIEMVSDKFIPAFKPQEMYLKLQKNVDDLCKAKCGFVPKKESDCKGYREGNYSCKIRLISDNSSFHFRRSWLSLLQEDFMQLLELRNSLIELEC